MRSLRALGWDHPRCVDPMRACAQAWQRLGHPEVVWSFRSLAAFGDQPLEEAARGYDLVVIDHPFCGTAHQTGCLTPLDTLLSEDDLATLAADAVGASHTSYAYADRQWGLATDAACQVVALAPGHEPPASWDDALALARDLNGRSCTPLSPPHSISSFLSLTAGAGGRPASEGRVADPDVGEWALDVLTRLAACGPPAAFGWEPPDALALLTQADDAVLFVPLTYGYVTYATDRVALPCLFADVPNGGAVLGGAGLAVSSSASEPEAAAAFAAFASGAEAQRTLVAPAGGQPGSRAAWDDAALDAAAGGFYSSTRHSLETAWVRPRDRWWPSFQLDAGTLLTRALAERRPAPETFRALDDLYRERSAE